MTTVAFTLVGGQQWTGGSNYLLNLFRVLKTHDGPGLKPLLFVGDDVAEESIRPFAEVLSGSVVRSSAFDSRRESGRIARALLIGKVEEIERVFHLHRVDVAFEAAQYFGWRPSFSTLAWIPDFQHRHLPQMFSWSQRLKREFGHLAQVHSRRRIMLSSEDSRRDCEQFHPASRDRTEVVRFAVSVPFVDDSTGRDARERAGLPEKFLYIPNQFWRHKNHLGVIRALAVAVRDAPDMFVAASGNPSDVRHQHHFEFLRAEVSRLGLEDRFRFLGMLPYPQVIGLVAAAHSLVNPSFFEGWSTTVEEAKALGTPMLLSDLAVHREQADGRAVFFDPSSPERIADTLLKAWTSRGVELPAERMARAAEENVGRLADFARSFRRAVDQAMASRK